MRRFTPDGVDAAGGCSLDKSFSDRLGETLSISNEEKNSDVYYMYNMSVAKD